MPALTNTDVADMVAKLNAELQPKGKGCVATPRKMRLLLNQLEEYTSEVQWARNKYRALGVASIAFGPAGIAASELLGGGDVDVAQWRSDMANWQYRLAEYQRVLDEVPDSQLDTEEGCREIYPLVTAPLLDGLFYTVAPGVVLNDEEKSRILTGTGHPTLDVPADHPPGHSNPKPPDLISPFTLGNQIIVYQDFQKENLRRFIDDLIDNAKKLGDPDAWPWWLKGALIAAAGVGIGWAGLYLYRKLPAKKAAPKSVPSAETSMAKMNPSDRGGGVASLSPKAKRYWELNKGALTKKNSFYTYTKGAKKTIRILVELYNAGLVDIYTLGSGPSKEYVVTGKGNTIQTLYGTFGPGK